MKGKNTMKIFDTHTHLNVEEFAGREEEELQLASEMGVSKINIVGFDRPTIERALELADSYDQLMLRLAGIRLRLGRMMRRWKPIW